MPAMDEKARKRLQRVVTAVQAHLTDRVVAAGVFQARGTMRTGLGAVLGKIPMPGAAMVEGLGKQAPNRTLKKANLYLFAATERDLHIFKGVQRGLGVKAKKLLLSWPLDAVTTEVDRGRMMLRLLLTTSDGRFEFEAPTLGDHGLHEPLINVLKGQEGTG